MLDVAIAFLVMAAGWAAMGTAAVNVALALTAYSVLPLRWRISWAARATWS